MHTLLHRVTWLQSNLSTCAFSLVPKTIFVNFLKLTNNNDDDYIVIVIILLIIIIAVDVLLQVAISNIIQSERRSCELL